MGTDEQTPNQDISSGGASTPPPSSAPSSNAPPAPDVPAPNSQPILGGSAPKPGGSKMLWFIGIALAVVVVAVVAFLLLKPRQAAAPTVTSIGPKVRIGISMDTVQGLRWAKDRQYLLAEAAKQGATATLLVADADDALQVSQIENLVSQHVDVLIVIPHSSAAVKPAIQEAEAAGIKVVSYDRLTLDSNIDFYVSFDNAKVGENEAQGVVDALPKTGTNKLALVGGAPTDNNATLIHDAQMSVVTPLVQASKAKVVYDERTTDWQPDLAYASFKNFLASGNTVDGVIAANDGVAGGVIRALEEKGLAGKVAVSGQDADLPAIQDIVAGKQTMTNYKSVKQLAARAVSIAVDLAHDKAPQTNANLDNGVKKVPSYLLNPIVVKKSNIRATVIRDGWLTEKQVYGN